MERVPFGLLDGRWMSPHEVPSGARNVNCPACAAPVSVVRDHTRSGADVVKHFRHAADVSCELMGESWLHKAAKIAVVATVARWRAGGPGPMIELDCVRCGKCVRAEIGRKRPILGARLEEALRTATGEFRLDVALIGDGDVVVGGVEVFVTHEIGSSKREALSQAGLGVVEVDAAELLGAPLVWKERSRWRCARCSDSAAPTAARRRTLPRPQLSAGPEPAIAARRIRGSPRLSSEDWRAVENGEIENPLEVYCPEMRKLVAVKRICARCPFFVAVQWWSDDVTVFCNSPAPLRL